MSKLAVFLLITLAAAAEKKPITLETLNQAGRGGRGGTGMPGPPTWSPDGKTFVVRQGRTLMIYDPATRTSKSLLDTTPIDAAAMTPHAEDGPVDWTNRRA